MRDGIGGSGCSGFGCGVVGLGGGGDGVGVGGCCGFLLRLALLELVSFLELVINGVEIFIRRYYTNVYLICRYLILIFE